MTTRRDFVVAGLAAMALPGVSAATDINANPEALLRALIKLRGSLDERPVFSWLSGMRYGVVDGRIDPIYRMHAGSVQLYRRINDRRYEMIMLELSYFADVDTGKPLKAFKNPYSGRVVEIPQQKLGPYKIFLTTEGVEIPRDPAFGEFELRTQLGPAVVQNDDIWIREDSFINVDSDHPMMGKHTYNEFVTYHGSLADVKNEALVSAPVDVTYQSVTSWRKWMGAEGVGGQTTARAAGSKVFALEDLPVEYLRVMRDWYPEIMQDPVSVLRELQGD